MSENSEKTQKDLASSSGTTEVLIQTNRDKNGKVDVKSAYHIGKVSMVDLSALKSYLNYYADIVDNAIREMIKRDQKPLD